MAAAGGVRAFVTCWQAGDRDGKYVIDAFGRCEDGRSVCVHVSFVPYMYTEVPREWSDVRVRSHLSELVETHGALRRYSGAVSKTSAWGYQTRPRKLLQLGFESLAKLKAARYKLKKTYESSIDPVVRFFHVRDVQPGSWVAFSDLRPCARLTTCDLEYSAAFTGVSPAPEIATRPPLVLASWDIEAYSASGAFPDPDKEEDQVIQIAVAFQKFGEASPFRQVVVCLGDTDPVAGVEIVVVHDEVDLIHEFARVLREADPDALIGYNVWGFDWSFLNGRREVLVDDADGAYRVDFGQFGRMRDAEGATREWSLNSGAFGNNKFFAVTVPGVLDVDLLQYFRREHKMDSYSLNSVSKQFLGDSKLDLPAWQIFEKFRGSSADRACIAEYAAKDTALPLALLGKLCILENLLEMANAVRVPVDYLLTRGQQIKVFSLLLKKAREMDFVVPDNVGIGADGKFEGATVLDPIKGAYLDKVVSTLDFASLYPSIMRAHNICYSSIVLEDDQAADVRPEDVYEIETGLGTFRFVQSRKGVMPALLEDLAEYRKNAKRAMADAKRRGDDFGYARENGKQLAYKISMNSAYGFTGATKGFLPCVPLAASVTATGRNMIMHTKRLVETLLPGSRVIYGDTDSVFCILDIGSDKSRDIHAHFQAAERLAQQITDTFNKPVELEFEKCYFPLLMFAKKRYAGLMFTDPEKPDKIDVKGLQLVRRDNPPIVKDASRDVLNAIMYDRSVDTAVDRAREVFRRVLAGDVPMDSLVVSKALRGSYAAPDSQPHLQVARKIQARTGERIPPGTRVPFVYIEDTNNPDGLLAMRAEDPAFVASEGLRVDTLYYIDRQLVSPLETLFSILGVDVQRDILGHDDIGTRLAELRAHHAEVVRTAKRVRKNTSNKQNEITRFFKPTSSSV